MSLPEKLQAIVDEIESTPDREFRSEILIDFAKRFKDVPSSVATRPFDEKHRTPACQSEAFVWAVREAGGGVTPYFAVENPQGISAKALAVILSESLTGERPEVIKSVDESVVLKLFGNSLSMGKGEGLMGMIRMLKALA